MIPHSEEWIFGGNGGIEPIGLCCCPCDPFFCGFTIGTFCLNNCNQCADFTGNSIVLGLIL